jgi:hypothetical protein
MLKAVVYEKHGLRRRWRVKAIYTNARTLSMVNAMAEHLPFEAREMRRTSDRNFTADWILWGSFPGRRVEVGPTMFLPVRD